MILDTKNTLIEKDSIHHRNSTLELLRIICIVLIVSRHYSTQTNFSEVGYTFTASNWSWRMLFLQLITFGGSASNNIFLLISGYFMLGRKVNWKRVVLLIVELFFYSWIIMAILFGTGVVPFTIKEFVKGIVPLWFGYNWYVCCYVILCCFLPFINPFLDGLSKEKYRGFLVVIFLIANVAGTFKAMTFIGDTYSVDHFLFMFAIGGYIKKFGIKPSKLSWYKTWSLLSAAVIILSIFSMSVLGGMLGIDKLVSKAKYFTPAYTVFAVFWGIFTFLWALNAKPFYNKTINLISGSVVGIFIIHHNPLMKEIIWNKIFPNVDYLNSDLLPVHFIIKVTCVLFLCFIIDQIRILTVEKFFRKILDEKWDWLETNLINIGNKAEECIFNCFCEKN